MVVVFNVVWTLGFSFNLKKLGADAYLDGCCTNMIMDMFMHCNIDYGSNDLDILIIVIIVTTYTLLTTAKALRPLMHFA